MNEKYIAIIAAQANISQNQVLAVIELLDADSTIPFIARYRKEATGSLDEVQITTIRDLLDQLRELDKRRDYILESIEKQGKLTEELKAKILAAINLTDLEDIYLPYKPKRRTRATIAKEKGLEPLAAVIFEQKAIDCEKEAAKYIDKEKGVETVEDALAGARDIIAEQITEDKTARDRIRQLYHSQGKFVCKVVTGKEEEGIKYKDYFDWSEPVAKAPSHRILAMRRGVAEKFLLLKIDVDKEKAVEMLERLFVTAEGDDSKQVALAAEDSFKRLLSISIATEIRMETKVRADEEAVNVFVENIRELLMASPLGQKNVLAIDPGFRTGCKVVCLDAQGKLIHNDNIYPHTSKVKAIEDGEKIKVLCERFKIQAIAIGNGTASRETESYINSLGLAKDILVVMANAGGASVYSASAVAREEFKDYDITVRGAVSIGRRLMDPLAELVKIDPKSIGVGQYQHDVDQKMLKKSLDDTVVSCVSKVGVEANTASKQLLTYVSGMSSSLADRFVKFRNENGPFKAREDFMKVSGLGEKTFQQCAGFLRIRQGDNPLDSSSVHPESYPIVSRMAGDLNCQVADLIKDNSLREKIELDKYVTDTVGLPTLTDIKSELAKPGLDPREKFVPFSFTEGVEKIGDLKVGMKIPGIVTNVTAFGAFVDLGVHQDGLVHISQLSDSFVKDIANVVKVQQKVMVTVMEVDVARSRIALSMKSKPFEEPKAKEANKKPQRAKKPIRNSQKPKPRTNQGDTFGDFLNIKL